METQPNVQKISVTWRGKKLVVEMNLDATVKELGQELQQLTNIQEDTMRLIVPKISNKTSKLLSPFSVEHAFLSLQEASITEAGTIKMMGVSTNEIEEVLQNAKANLRIAGFDEEEKRLKQRISYGPSMSLKLPQGPYIFADFHTLEIPGVVLNPPPSEALKRMHMLAADPGIVAIMNKHHWRVGIMTEMAPVGYVGVSPKCILGFNKNHGEEISLRLRTDDLRGFRKYESIKKTLLHELAHMVYSEHDANFYSLDKQLNQEAASLDWRRSASHTLVGIRNSESYEQDFLSESKNFSQKVGGDRSDQLPSARASSVAAAYRRMANVSGSNFGGSGVKEEPDPDDSSFNTSEEPDHLKAISKAVMDVEIPICAEKRPSAEPDPDDHLIDVLKHECDPDNSLHGNVFYSGFSSGLTCGGTIIELKPHDFKGAETLHNGTSSETLVARNISEEPDPDDSETSLKNIDGPDSDDMEAENNDLKHENSVTRDLGASLVTNNIGHQVDENNVPEKPAYREFHAKANVLAEPDPDDVAVPSPELSKMQTDEPDPDDEELQRIHDPVTILCNRLQKALEMLRAEVSPMPIASVLQTLVKIIRNIIEHPEETKYKRLRKANPIIERNIVKYKAAMEILSLIGFNEDVIRDELGKAESYLVLKRNDPGLLWLAKSSLESCIVC